jgi:zinc transport system substrate-binding protein
MVLILVAAVAFGPACGGEEGASSAGTMDVAASLYPLAFAAETIGGPRADVTNLTPPGTEPHDVELSVRDVERVRSADVVFFLGSGFQPAVERAVAGGDGEAIDLLEGLTRAGDEQVDPHVWLDPLRYAGLAQRIGDTLGRTSAAAEFDRRLRALDAEFEGGLAECERREIVTSHDAFSYLADRYGLQQIAVSGISPEAEPTPSELERVVSEVRSHGATTVFVETLVSPRLAETVAREADAKVATLNPIEGLTEEEADAGEDYFSLMRANLAALREALGCR